MSDTKSEASSFVPLEHMPTMRLNDIMRNLSKDSTTVVNLDALIPPKEAGEPVLKTLLLSLKPSVKVLSFRFNNFSAGSIDYLIEWLARNDYLEIVYFMGAALDEKNRKRLEDAWKKNLTGHRLDNMGLTFIRVTIEKQLEFQQQAEA